MPRLRALFRAPSRAELEQLAQRAGLPVTEEELDAFEDLARDAATDLDLVDAEPQPRFPPFETVRESRTHPGRDDDPYNLFIRFCDIAGAPKGPLHGMRVAVKDNISVAGVPTTNGSRALPHFVPTQDAVVVERLLRAGAHVIGKTNMDDFAFAGNGETSAFGPPRNPRDPARSAGGSSGGSAGAVAAGMADLGIAVDQAGSGRIPASWCGVASIKPTRGLVPTYGITYVDHTLDHVCPVAARVDDLARALKVIAGADVRDPLGVVAPPLIDTEPASLIGLRLGVVTEAVEVASPDVRAAFEHVVAGLAEGGALVDTVSLPRWRLAPAVLRGIQQSLAGLVASGGEGYGRLGYVDVERQAWFGSVMRSTPADLPPLFKFAVMFARYLEDQYAGTYWGKAQNIRMELAGDIDAALAERDALLMPTTPTVAYPLGTEAESLADFIRRGNSMLANTCPLNLSGHPAVSVPAGVGESGLPVGLQIVGRHFDDLKALSIAGQVESATAATVGTPGERVA